MKTDITLSSIAVILEKAGQDILLPAFHSSVRTSSKSDGSVVTESDMACQHFIQGELGKLDHTIAFLGEEMPEAEQLACLRQGHHRYWCLDPLDGTSNFASHLPNFALSLALIENGRVQLACILDPVRNESFTARRGDGAYLNGVPIKASHEDAISNAIGYIDFKRLDVATAISLVRKKLYRSQRNMGSCALEWAWLAAGRGQFIVHGSEKVWDFAAGSLIATEAGCMAGNFAGKPLFPDACISSPVLAACNSPIHKQLMRRLKCQTA